MQNRAGAAVLVADMSLIPLPVDLRLPDALREDLSRFVSLLVEWQEAHNLVAPSTLSEVWTRHVADSLQLLDHAPAFGEWVDLGSGAGFPGLVVAIASKSNPERHFTLVEASRKKAAFLRAAVRLTEANATVAGERIESHALTMRGSADIVSARALAPLHAICGLAYPYLKPSSVILLLKGQDFVNERHAATKSWRFDVVSLPSTTNAEGNVVAIRDLQRREGS